MATTSFLLSSTLTTVYKLYPVEYIINRESIFVVHILGYMIFYSRQLLRKVGVARYVFRYRGYVLQCNNEPHPTSTGNEFHYLPVSAYLSVHDHLIAAKTFALSRALKRADTMKQAQVSPKLQGVTAEIANVYINL